MDQFDYGLEKRKRLVNSQSFISRRRPAVVASLATSSNAPYITQLISPSEAVLVSYSDDGFFRYHDKASLKSVNSVKWERGGNCTCLISTEQGYMATGQKGFVGYWDARQDKELATLAGPSRAPYLSLASSGNMVAAGTELQGTDATIDIWDLRQPSKPVTSYVEAHSDDVTWLSFHPNVSFALLSASSDSLVAISDIRKTDEDDSVLGVINTGSSVARAGWGGSSTIRPKVKMVDEDEEAAKMTDLPDLGAFWSVSDMQTVGIWEADAWEELIPPIDVRAGEAELSTQWKTEFIINASADSQLLEGRDSIGLSCGNQDGSTALIQIPNQSEQDWTIHCLLTGGHSEPVRSILWDVKNSCVFTGAEDGLICGWQLAGGSQDPIDTSLTLSPTQHKSPGAIKEERSRNAYRPY